MRTFFSFAGRQVSAALASSPTVITTLGCVASSGVDGANADRVPSLASASPASNLRTRSARLGVVRSRFVISAAVTARSSRACA